MTPSPNETASTPIAGLFYAAFGLILAGALSLGVMIFPSETIHDREGFGALAFLVVLFFSSAGFIFALRLLRFAKRTFMAVGFVVWGTVSSRQILSAASVAISVATGCAISRGIAHFPYDILRSQHSYGMANLEFECMRWAFGLVVAIALANWPRGMKKIDSAAGTPN